MDYRSLKPFPQGFLWGGSSSAYQCEGAYLDEGRTLSVSDTAPVPEGIPRLFGDSVPGILHERLLSSLLRPRGIPDHRFH